MTQTVTIANISNAKGDDIAVRQLNKHISNPTDIILEPGETCNINAGGGDVLVKFLPTSVKFEKFCMDEVRMTPDVTVNWRKMK